MAREDTSSDTTSGHITTIAALAEKAKEPPLGNHFITTVHPENQKENKNPGMFCCTHAHFKVKYGKLVLWTFAYLNAMEPDHIHHVKRLYMRTIKYSLAMLAIADANVSSFL